MSTITRYYKQPALSSNQLELLRSELSTKLTSTVTIQCELCFNIGLSAPLTEAEQTRIVWILSANLGSGVISEAPRLAVSDASKKCDWLLEIGPRLNFCTAASTNAVSICHAVGIKSVDRIETSRRYLFCGAPDTADAREQIIASVHDRMTECVYTSPLESFHLSSIEAEPVYDIDILNGGSDALEQANRDLGLALDAWDIEYYTGLFMERVQRNPTSVECFDLAQSNSEHCRHWFFKGHMTIDGEPQPKSLMELVMDTQDHSNRNNVIMFADNSSAIRGFPVPLMLPLNPSESSCYDILEKERHLIFTAETHNFPTGVAPFPGATTGTGGRIRDTHAAGQGSHVIAATAGYCFGNLNIPGYELPWEDDTWKYPENFAKPLNIAIEASNGASDYGNKFGEPVIAGFARSCGLMVAEETPGTDGWTDERREWIKPIMFSAGIGAIDDEHIVKKSPVRGMEVVKIGGPAYRIGVGGGAASSVQVQGDNKASLDFGAVQRGDAEMEQKLNRLVRACIEMGENNPICSIHDQGAGGNGNVLKEICEPAGAVIRLADIGLGDASLSALEVWGAEYQESDAILISPQDREVLTKIGQREKVPVCFVGEITGDGRIVLEDNRKEKDLKRSKQGNRPVDLPLDVVLGKMPTKRFTLERRTPLLRSLQLPTDLTVADALHRVLRLPAVASKRYLTNKVDRSVTGLVAQQQCVGPLHTPVADCGVIALSHFDLAGGATAIGEQPIKMLIDAARGARLTVAEAFTNLVFAKITDIKDVKCSANWMWPAKLPGEGARLYDACGAMCDLLSTLGAAVDGGKDSLSMAARVEKTVVKAPGSLVVSVYAPCPDVRVKVTPDLQPSRGGALLYVNMGGRGKEARLGGSALAQCYKQIGEETPDVDSAEVFSTAFQLTQQLIADRVVLAGHDVSDGGLITTLLEMAFAGNCGIDVNISGSVTNGSGGSADAIRLLFAEEVGIVLEIAQAHVGSAVARFTSSGVHCDVIGRSTVETRVQIRVADHEVLTSEMNDLRDVWEETSFQLERLQTARECVLEEQEKLRSRQAPPFNLTFEPKLPVTRDHARTYQVAVIREEGSNGDREMSASLMMAGFRVVDVTMSDLCEGRFRLDDCRGVVFVGGFSYADVFGSAKGWAAVAAFNQSARSELERFRCRDDTFSLGVCNGCQLMALLGWVGGSSGGKEILEERAAISSTEALPEQTVCFERNISERFESRFVTVSIEKSEALMLRGMEDSRLGVWVAHGEGRPQFRDDESLRNIIDGQLAPIRYVDDNGQPTQQYPLNPNGAPHGIAGLCSQDGRHLAMMPHPERCTLLWQWPWLPEEWNTLPASPWLQMFHNAYDWCSQTGA